MPRTEEQKIRKKIADKKWGEANKEKKSLHAKKYYQENKEKQLENHKIWSDTHKEQKTMLNKKWAKNNPDKIRITKWKGLGIICNDFEVIYRIYMDTNNCDFCQCEFKNSKDRNLDHDHSITDSFNIRGILCMRCNITDKLKGYDIMDLDGDL